jgi:hypothetical protein
MVKKSAEGYLGKYMSKGCQDVAHFVEMGQESYVPGQWWFCTREMRQWVKSETLKGPNTGKLVESIIDFHCQVGFKDSGVWAMPFFLDIQGVSMLVAWVGRFSKEFYGNLREWLLK